MNRIMFRRTCTLAASGILFGAIGCLAESGAKAHVEIEAGTATFEATTNMPGTEIRGKSNTLSGRVEVLEDANGLVLQRIEASLGVKTLSTGMKVRDEHMRKHIFQTPDGQEPDLYFAADTGMCPASGSTHQFTCQVPGHLTIRGISRAVEIRLRVKEQQGSVAAFRVEGEGVVSISDYGIPLPSQLGVKPGNEVKVHLDFTGKQRSTTAASVERKN